MNANTPTPTILAVGFFLAVRAPHARLALATRRRQSMPAPRGLGRLFRI